MPPPIAGRVRLRAGNIYHVQHLLLNSSRLAGLTTRAHHSLTTTSPLRPTTSSNLNTSTTPPFFRRILGQGRKLKSTNSEPQPERAPSPTRSIKPDCTLNYAAKLDDALHQNGGEHEVAETSREDRATMREVKLATPLIFFQTNFPEADGFHHSMGPVHRDITYTRMNERGEKVAVTIPRDDACLFLAVGRGDPQTRVNGIKVGGAVCIALSVVLPSETAGGMPPNGRLPLFAQGNGSDPAIDATRQALLEYINLLQDPDYMESVPIENRALEGCMAMLCIDGEAAVFEYSKERGLYNPPDEVVSLLRKTDEKFRTALGLPPRHSLPPDPQPELSDSPQRPVFSDDVATEEETAAVSQENNQRKSALKIPLALFQARFPQEAGFEHWDVGHLQRDIHYTELGAGEEEVAVTIPRNETRLYLAVDKNSSHVVCAALYVLPPAVASSSSEPENAAEAALPWGRGISAAAMDAVWRELQEVFKQLQDVRHNDGDPPFGILMTSCMLLPIMGLEMGLGAYNEEKGFQWRARGPVVADGHGLSHALDPSNYYP